MYCKYCDKECKNKNSLSQHEVRCKLNPEKIIVISNFISYNEKISNGDLKKENTNQFSKAEKLGLPKPIISDETRYKFGSGTRNKFWSEDKKERHSKIMTQVAIDNPLSYSANNVCGRTKLHETIDSYGLITKLNGAWELLVANYLDSLNIKWTNIIDNKIMYHWNGKDRRYYPDFYLPEFDMYIEVKGYQRDRDLQKWKSLNNLIILKQKEITKIKENTFDIFTLLG